jgi:puromycin-sensitive aminopeptidase
MAWWDDLWLNEGFASWAENYAADQNYPEYEMWPQFVNDHLSRALKLGASVRFPGRARGRRPCWL